MPEQFVLRMADGDTTADVVTLLREHGYTVNVIGVGDVTEYRVK